MTYLAVALGCLLLVQGHVYLSQHAELSPILQGRLPVISRFVGLSLET